MLERNIVPESFSTRDFTIRHVVSRSRVAELVKRQYRNRIEITANILELAKQGSRKTRIMYLGNLSFDLVQKYLKQLEQFGLVEIKGTEKGERIYNITTRGVEFLSDFYELQKHSEIVGNKKKILENALRIER